MQSVNPARTYASPLRRRQAEATRRAVLDAARGLFVERGYGGTTVDLVAARAGVSKPTVFTSVGNKQTLLRAVRERAIAGDDLPVPIAHGPRAADIAAQPDLGIAIDLIAEFIAEVHARYAPIHAVLLGAAHGGEDELRDLWDAEEQERLVIARHWIGVLVGRAPLRRGLDRRSATDILWLLMAPDQFQRLTRTRRWTRARYQRWLASSIEALLAPPNARRN